MCQDHGCGAPKRAYPDRAPWRGLIHHVPLLARIAPASQLKREKPAVQGIQSLRVATANPGTQHPGNGYKKNGSQSLGITPRMIELDEQLARANLDIIGVQGDGLLDFAYIGDHAVASPLPGLKSSNPFFLTDLRLLLQRHGNLQREKGGLSGITSQLST